MQWRKANLGHRYWKALLAAGTVFGLLNLALLFAPAGRLHEIELPRTEWYTYTSERFGFYFEYPERLELQAPLPTAIAAFAPFAGQDEPQTHGRLEILTLELPAAEDEEACALAAVDGVPAALEFATVRERGQSLTVASGPETTLVCRLFGERWYVLLWRGEAPPYFYSSAASMALGGSGRFGPDPRPAAASEWELAELSQAEQQALYYHAPLPNIQPLMESPQITGDAAADAHIYALATRRGYRLQFEPQVVPTSETELIQPAAYGDWQALVAAAAADGITLGLTSTYRTIAEQRTLFLERLGAWLEPSDYQAIPSGDHDAVLMAVMDWVSPPGYSRHHTGYALDISDETPDQAGLEFKDTRAFEWLSADNYANALAFNFIPSFPKDVTAGPEPEEWEYLWVGG